MSWQQPAPMVKQPQGDCFSVQGLSGASAKLGAINVEYTAGYESTGDQADVIQQVTTDSIKQSGTGGSKTSSGKSRPSRPSLTREMSTIMRLHRKHVIQDTARSMGLLLLLLATVGATLVLIMEGRGMDSAMFWPAFFSSLGSYFATFVAATLILKGNCYAHFEALVFVMVLWLLGFTSAGYTAFCNTPIWRINFIIRSMILPFATLLGLHLVFTRLKALEVAIKRPMHLQYLRRTFKALAGCSAMSLTLYAITNFTNWQMSYRAAILAVHLSSLVLYQAYSVLSAMKFHEPRLWLDEIRRGTECAKLKEECTRAMREVKGHMVGVLLSTTATVMTLIVRAVFWAVAFSSGDVCENDDLADSLTVAGPWLLHIIANLCMVCLLIGFRDVVRIRRDSTKYVAEIHRARARKASMEQWEPDENDEWQQKVEELAGRGFTIRVLLDFYRGLGERYMHNYRPDVHKTKDVVACAIIPLTAAAQCSYAEMAMRGKRTRPKKMISHHWDNLFCHLCAAIISEVLQETSYGMVACLLNSDLDALERKLSDEKLLDETVWVCAFSVNQHTSICNIVDGRCTDRDPPSQLGVQGANGIDAPPKEIGCRCGCPKYLNHTPPLREDGQSIRCEMNKFCDMVAFLSVQDLNFHQLVVVDTDFNVFTRAWVIAEIAEGYTRGLMQTLVLPSAEALAENEEKIQNLRVEDMQASRPEDVELILEQIDDKQEFNRQLHTLIADRHSGLLAEWAGLNDIQRLSKVGRLARWQLSA